MLSTTHYTNKVCVINNISSTFNFTFIYMIEVFPIHFMTGVVSPRSASPGSSAASFTNSLIKLTHNTLTFSFSFSLTFYSYFTHNNNITPTSNPTRGISHLSTSFNNSTNILI